MIKLSPIELDSIKFSVSSILRTNYSNLTFYIMSYRDSGHVFDNVKMAGVDGISPNDNTIIIRSSFYNYNGIEFADMVGVDAMDPELNDILLLLGEGFEEARKKKWHEV